MSFPRRLLRVLCMKIPALTIRTKDSTVAASGLATALTLAGLLAPPLYAAAVSVGLSPVRSQLVQTFPFGSGGPGSRRRTRNDPRQRRLQRRRHRGPRQQMPYDDVAFGSGTVAGAGSVYVHLGAAGAGLASTSGWFRLSQASGANTPAEEESFGFALTAADFNNDGFDDLAVGVPRDVQGGVAKGGVQVFFGSGNPAVFGPGLVLGIGGSANDHIGLALTAGHFDDDIYEDLAVGIPGRDAVAGAVFVIYGESGGLGSGGQFSAEQSGYRRRRGAAGPLRLGSRGARLQRRRPRRSRGGSAAGERLRRRAALLWRRERTRSRARHSVDPEQHRRHQRARRLLRVGAHDGDFDGDATATSSSARSARTSGSPRRSPMPGRWPPFGDAAGFDLSRTVAWGQGGFIGFDVPSRTTCSATRWRPVTSTATVSTT